MAQETMPFVNLFLVSLLVMQTSSAISQSPQALPSSVRPVVRLDITVFDASGNAVTDLKADDLEVADGGKPQPAAYLRHDYDERGQSAKLPPGEFSNRNGGPNPRAIAILLDLLNESLENRGLVVAEVERELQKLEMADYVYLYLLAKDGSVSAVHPVPKPEELTHPAPWTQQIHENLDRAIQNLPQIRTQQLSRLNQPDFVKVTLDALAKVASPMTLIPGRRNLIWITEGVPVSMRILTQGTFDFRPQLRTFSLQLASAGIVILPVLPSVEALSTTAEERESLKDIADFTGGPAEPYPSFTLALNQAVQSAHGTYRVVYDPPEKNWDKKYHKIKITCKRAGIRIQAEQGYLADPAQFMSAADEQSAASRAQASPFDIREIGLHVSIGPPPSPQGTGSAKGHLEIRVNLPDVLLLRSGANYQGRLSLAITRFDADGSRYPAEKAVDVDVTEAQWDKMMAEGFTISDDDPRNADSRRFRITVFDRGSRSVGAITFAPK